ncbi:MAG: gamma-glutamyltransferase family protein, partial [Planctomycetota bacterium]
MTKLARRPRIDTDLLDLGNQQEYHPQRLAASKGGMIATQHYLATEAGNEMLKNGGNAFDAAVAAAFALGVCEPGASGLGGQTMLLAHHAESRQAIAIDGSSRAPNLASPSVFSKKVERRIGYKATTVPSTPAVLSYVLKKYGTKSLSSALEPAIRLAMEGYPVSPLQFALTRRELKSLKTGTAAPLFLREGVRPYAIGTMIHQPVLANTLSRLAEEGIEDFYFGQIAAHFVADMERNDGLITREDLAQIPWPIERRPVTCRFGSGRLFSFPPPGAGRPLVEMVNIYDNLPESLKNIDSTRGAVVLALTIQQAFLDRRDRPYDPSFFTQATAERMLDTDYARKLSRTLQKRIRTQGETTHLSVMDKEGNVVGLTQSIERVYGSYCASLELGFLYNNYMCAFEYEDITHPYYMRPNAAPWASVAPTIVVRGKRPWVVLGSPGSERITSSVFQVLMRLAKLGPLAAVDAPRMHCSLAGKVSLEVNRMRDDIPRALEKAGFEIDRRDPYSFYLGCVQLVMRQ